MRAKRQPDTNAPLHPRTRQTINLTLSPEAKEALFESAHDERVSQSVYVETLIMREETRKGKGP